MNIDAFEIRRKIFHITVGIVLVLLIYFNLLKLWMAITIFILGLLIALNAKYRKIHIKSVDWFLEKFDRKHHFPGRGPLAIFLGLIFLMIFFEKNIVMASLMILTFGDSISALVGKHYGKYKHPFNDTRLIEGTIAGIIVGAATAMIFIPWYAALIAAFIAMTIESLELRFMKHPIDDNFLVPVISGIVIWIVMVVV